MWSLMPQTDQGSNHLGVPVRGSVRLSEPEARTLCEGARRDGLVVHGNPPPALVN